MQIPKDFHQNVIAKKTNGLGINALIQPTE